MAKKKKEPEKETEKKEVIKVDKSKSQKRTFVRSGSYKRLRPW
jgi:hypothetical protein